jgi:DNA-binding CsgD family transcriptional regulator
MGCVCCESDTAVLRIDVSTRRRSSEGDLDSPRGQKCRRGPPVCVARLGVRTAAHADGTGLSPREREVLRLATVGHTNRDNARNLFPSPQTVDMHVRNTPRKPDCRSRVQAPIRARDRI